MKPGVAIALCTLVLAPLALSGGGDPQGRGGRRRGSMEPRRGVPEWKLDAEFKRDAFTFVRVEYDQRHRPRWDRGGDWRTDYPDSDLNFSFRLQQLTALDVDPDGLTMRLTDPRLFEYPFLYMIEPGDLLLNEREVVSLRTYCQNGGFLMVDDFWGDEEWDVFYYEIKKVFPGREPRELPLEHEIFHCVYDLKEKPQVPSSGVARRGRSYETRWGSDTTRASYSAIEDDDGRIMVLICFNTDLGDGWEREGEEEAFFREYSAKKAYPMGINIVTYAMTH